MNPIVSMKCVQRASLALAAISALVLMAACGSSNSGPPPNQQGFSNSSLSGTYVFSFFGTDVSSPSGAFPFAVVGQLVADGKGHFTSGTVDVNDPGIATVIGSNNSLFPAVSTTGSYSVATDGRATGTITLSISGTNGVPMGLDFVLMTSSHGLITRFDSNGSGSGTIDLQTSGLNQASFVGSYGISTTGFDFTNFNPIATAGFFTLDSVGAATGVFDLNSNGTNVPGGTTGLTLGSGSGMLVQSPVTTATFVTSSGTLTFDVYPISSSHLKFIETDSIALTAGDAFSSQSSIPSGVYAYTAEAGNPSSPVAMGGFVTSDGTSVFSNGLEEINNVGNLSSVSITGSFGAFNGGRTELTLNGFVNGGALPQSLQFAAYPTTGGVLFLENDSVGITTGTMLAQGSTATIGTSQGYGLNLSAFNSSGEEDAIAQFNVNSSNAYTGSADINDVAGIGGSSRGVSFTGTLTPDSTIAGHGSVTNSSLFNFNYYTANSGATTLILETDNSQVGVGSFQLQQSGVTPAAASAHFLALKPSAAAKAAMKKFKNK